MREVEREKKKNGMFYISFAEGFAKL